MGEFVAFEVTARSEVKDIDAMIPGVMGFMITAQTGENSDTIPLAGILWWVWRHRNSPPICQPFWGEYVGRPRSWGVVGTWVGGRWHTLLNFTSTIHVEAEGGQAISTLRPDHPTTAPQKKLRPLEYYPNEEHIQNFTPKCLDMQSRDRGSVPRDP